MTQSIEVPAGTKPLLRVSSRSGRVEVYSTPAPRITLESSGSISPGDKPDEFVVHGNRPSERVIVHCPEGCDLLIGTSSGAVELHGRLGSVKVTTTSGDVRVQDATKADLRLMSGKASVDRCGMLRVQTASGDVAVGICGTVEIAVASGKIEVGEAGQVRARAASGNVSVKVRGDAAIETISGKVKVGVVEGLHPQVRLRSLGGKTRNECAHGDDLRISVQTVIGDIEVVSG